MFPPFLLNLQFCPQPVNLQHPAGKFMAARKTERKEFAPAANLTRSLNYYKIGFIKRRGK